MTPTDRQRQYWQQSQRLTAGLLVLWFLVTVLSIWFAETLNQIVLLGFPMGFYMGAQGTLIIYLGIIWFYGHSMNRRDAAAGVTEREDE